MSSRTFPQHKIMIIFILVLLLVSACSGSGSATTIQSPTAAEPSVAEPALHPISLAAGESLRVAATTSIIGDIVSQIGGDHITLFTLIAPGIDPHSYTPTPEDLRTLHDVDIVFINGLQLEEGLMDLLNEIAAPKISVNRDVALLQGAEDEASHEAHNDEAHNDEVHTHSGFDPHTWQSIPNVQQWVQTIATTLSTVDPSNRTAYQEAATSYNELLATLDHELRALVDTIPPTERKLITDHESFNYFARDYGFTIIGTLIPSLSSLAESSAQGLADLQDQIAAEKAPAIFIGTTANPDLADQLASDLGIAVVPLYTGALSDSDGPASIYVDFMRYNVNAIVTALAPKE